MKAFRSASLALAFLLIAILPSMVFAQTVTDEKGVVVTIHRFQPVLPAQNGAAPNSAPKKGEINTSAQQQMNAMVLEKQSRTAVQNKISSRLLFTSRMLQG